MARQRGSGSRMGKQWGDIPAISLSLTADGTSSGGALISTTSQTVLRMLGGYTIGLAGIATAADAVRIGVGIGIISTDAFNLGATAMPDPLGELDFPWLYWNEHSLRYPAAAGTSAGQGVTDARGWVRHKFDIRSMRKMKPRENLVVVIEYADTNGAPPMRVDVDQTRVLIGLH